MTTKTINLNAKEFSRYESLLRVFGIKYESDVTWRLTSFLSEIPEPYLRVFNSDNNVCRIVNLVK